MVGMVPNGVSGCGDGETFGFEPSHSTVPYGPGERDHFKQRGRVQELKNLYPELRKGKQLRVAGNAVIPFLSEESHYYEFFGTTNRP